VPLLVITPLVFLGGTFYSIDMLPKVWQKVSLFNPVVYLVSGFRWSFFEVADVSVALSLVMITLFMSLCFVIAWWMISTGYRLKQ
jgi:ABC-2 type transport system permease protein